MTPTKISTVDGYSVFALFGLAWFLPFLLYTLWAFGFLSLDAVHQEFIAGSTYEIWWARTAEFSTWIALSIQLAAGALFIRYSRTMSWRAVGFCRTTSNWFLLALAALVFCYLFSGLLNLIFQLPVAPEAAADGVSSQDEPPASTYSSGYVLFLLFMVGPATAIVEEVAFRGVLYGWLRKYIRPVSAVILSSLIFGAAHLKLVNPGGILGVSATVQVAIAGAILAVLYEKCGSLWPSIYLHGVNNTIGILQVIALR